MNLYDTLDSTACDENWSCVNHNQHHWTLEIQQAFTIEAGCCGCHFLAVVSRNIHADII